jgi:perosamine synthetase
MPRFVPPAGVPLKMKRVFAALFNTVGFSNGSGGQQFSKLASRLKVQYVFGTSSGRAALWLILRSLRRLRPDRDTVALPAYTCFSVAAAIVRAGLRLHLLEMNPRTLDFEPSALETLPDERLLCVITSNLFGLPNDLPAVLAAAQSKGAFVIDDAAQALGSMRDGRFAGTFGDVGIYSLGRGKAITALEGGIIVTNSEMIAHALKEEMKILKGPSMRHGAWLLLETLIYSAFLSPNFYWIPNCLPFLKLGVTEFNPAFPTEELHPFCRALFDSVLDSLAEVNQVRQANARTITTALSSMGNFDFPKPGANTLATFVRLPIIARDKSMRERAVNRLRDAGIGAARFYPTAICDIPELKTHMAVNDFHQKGAELLSDRLFTLPVNPLLTVGDRNRMIDLLATVST